MDYKWDVFRFSTPAGRKTELLNDAAHKNFDALIDQPVITDFSYYSELK